MSDNTNLVKDLAGKSFSKEAQDRIEVAISKLIVFKPIFGTVFMYLNKIQTHNVPTIGVGILRRVDLGLYYNPDFILGLTNLELRAVLTHEALHVLLHHIARSDHFAYNKKGYNIAADMAINCHIANLPPNGYYPSTFKLPDFQASEWYYEKLKQEGQKQGKSAGEFGESSGQQLIDSHDGWGDCEEDVVKEKIQSIADKCIKAQEEKGWSTIGTDLANAIIQANKPVINWKREVRWFINKLVLAGRTVTRSRINRREQAMMKNRHDQLKGVYIQPGTKRDFTSRLLVALDTSGSVSDAEIQAFIGEINGMCQHVECHVTMFDTSILQDPPIPIKKKIPGLSIKGRGGTDFNVAVRYAEAHKYDGLIVFTDGFCPFPAPPNNGCRVLWGITPGGDSVQPPYGKRVRIEIKQK